MFKALFKPLLLSLALLSANAHATLLTFDDVPGGSAQNNYGDMPTYKGFNFSFTLDWIDLVGGSYNFGAHSGDFGILNNNGGAGTITAVGGADFTFDGLWAKQWATAPQSGGADSLFGTLQGFNNGQLVWSVATGLNGSYEFYGPQSGAIDELVMNFGSYFQVDDILLNAPSTSTVPEPGTLALMGAAMLMLGMRRRKTPQ
jgi:PEP-CTERM motif